MQIKKREDRTGRNEIKNSLWQQRSCPCQFDISNGSWLHSDVESKEKNNNNK